MSFPVLSQIKPQAPLHGGAKPSIPLSFNLAIVLHQEPKDFDFSYGAEQSKLKLSNSESV